MEPARRTSLDDMAVLDTPPEERFDRITRLARLSFDVMLSTITLIDRDRAWTKSAAGAQRMESSRSHSFCTHTVAADAPVVVSDVTMDHRFAKLPAVIGPLGIRFYAGFPVHDGHGTAIGTLCLYDTRPRTLDSVGLAVMTELTAWVESELNAPDESDEPRAVRNAPLRRDAPRITGYDAAAFCHSATGSTGDYFDHRRQGDVGRSCRPGALMATVRETLHSSNRALVADRLDEPNSLGETLTMVNGLLLDDLSSTASVITGFFGCMDPTSGTIRYVDAGHGLTVVVRADGQAERLPASDLPLGVTDSWRWTEHSVTLHPGDDLVCFSDGVVDLLGGAEAIPAISQLVEDADDPHRVVENVRRLATASPEPTLRDVTVLAIRRTAA
jgi:sigma-B regulation protein RsbU (phosphoserine phosphatase)